MEMELSTMDKIESALGEIDLGIQEVNQKKLEVQFARLKESEKIDKFVANIKSGVNNAELVLKNQLTHRFKLVEEELEAKEAQFVVDKNELENSLESDIGQLELWLSKISLNDSKVTFPTFQPNKNLIKVKSGDVGYLRVAEYSPTDFTLVNVNTSRPGVGLCNVLTDQQFTNKVQNNIKFSVKNKTSKIPVTFLREECGLSQDRKVFSFAFHVAPANEYLVTVLLYDQPVNDSPHRFTVPIDTRQDVLLMPTVADVNKNLKVTPMGVSRSSENVVVSKDGYVKSDFIGNVHQVSNQGESVVLDKVEQNLDQLPIKVVENDSGKMEHGNDFKTLNTMIPGPTQQIQSDHGLKKVEVREEDNYVQTLNNNLPVAARQMQSVIGNQKREDNNETKTQSINLSVPVRMSVAEKISQSPDTSVVSDLLDFVSLADSDNLMCVSKISISLGPAEGAGKNLPTLNKPIGICLLEDKTIIISSTGEHLVKMFSPECKLIGPVTPSGKPFSRPSDLASLSSGQFVVRDEGRVQMFTPSGDHVRTIVSGERCYGLAEDDQGRLVTIQQSRNRNTDLLFYDAMSGDLVKKISMEDVIKDKQMSKCRFLTFKLGKLYITDLGLNCVYILDPSDGTAKVFGRSGTGSSCFSDPAGLVVDQVGNMVVADSRNHRLCLFNSYGKFHSEVKLSPEVRRPSGLLLDNKELYVLNLHGRSAMVKYSVGK